MRTNERRSVVHRLPARAFAAAATMAMALAVTASPAIAAPPAADLAITGSAPTASTAVFRSFAYTLTVTNLGPDSTNGVRVVGTLPAGQAFGSAKASTGACAAENVLSCDLGKLDANQSATIALIVSASSASNKSVTFTLTGNATDPVSANSSLVLPIKVAACTKYGTAGNDVLRGTRIIDVVCGLGGNDVLIGGLGDDILRGGLGNDTLRGGAGNNSLFGGSGNDVLRGGLGADRMSGQGGRDIFYAQDGVRDTISGGAGFDRAHLDKMLDVRSSIAELF